MKRREEREREKKIYAAAYVCECGCDSDAYVALSLWQSGKGSAFCMAMAFVVALFAAIENIDRRLYSKQMPVAGRYYIFHVNPYDRSTVPHHSSRRDQCQTTKYVYCREREWGKRIKFHVRFTSSLRMENRNEKKLYMNINRWPLPMHTFCNFVLIQCAQMKCSGAVIWSVPTSQSVCLLYCGMFWDSTANNMEWKCGFWRHLWTNYSN